jgi:cellobiose phosphorylase
LRKAGDTLHINPCIPEDWSSYQVAYRYGETVYQIQVENPEGVNHNVKGITLDGEEQPAKEISLEDDGQQHSVDVLMGAA